MADPHGFQSSNNFEEKTLRPIAEPHRSQAQSPGDVGLGLITHASVGFLWLEPALSLLCL